MGLLWCKGVNAQRISELYNILQNNDQPSIAHTDKNIAPTLETIFDFSTRLVFEKVYEQENKLEEAEMITDDQIEDAEETYVDLIEEFIDSVFESDSILSRDIW